MTFFQTPGIIELPLPRGPNWPRRLKEAESANRKDLRKAIREDEVEWAEAILEVQPELAITGLDRGFPTLHFMIEMNRIKMLPAYTRAIQRLQIKHSKAKRSRTQKYQWSTIITKSFGGLPMHIACRVGSLPFVKFLLDLGASPSQVNTHGSSPLTIACEKGGRELVSLLARLAPETLFQCDIVTTVSDISSQITPLTIAIMHTNMPAIIALVRADSRMIDFATIVQGADPRTATSPISYAILASNKEYIRFFRAMGAPIHLIDPAITFPWLDAERHQQQLQMLTEPISEEEILKIRRRVYFDDSLLGRLMEWII